MLAERYWREMTRRGRVDRAAAIENAVRIEANAVAAAVSRLIPPRFGVSLPDAFPAVTLPKPNCWVEFDPRGNSELKDIGVGVFLHAMSATGQSDTHPIVGLDVFLFAPGTFTPLPAVPVVVLDAAGNVLTLSLYHSRGIPCAAHEADAAVDAACVALLALSAYNAIGVAPIVEPPRQAKRLALRRNERAFHYLTLPRDDVLPELDSRPIPLLDIGGFVRNGYWVPSALLDAASYVPYVVEEVDEDVSSSIVARELAKLNGVVDAVQLCDAVA